MDTLTERHEVDTDSKPVKHVCMKFKQPTLTDATEKTYDIRCACPAGLPKTNLQHIAISGIPLYDMRSKLHALSLDLQGFLAVDLPIAMTYEDFFDEKKLQTVYAEQVRSYLLQSLGASCVFFHECVIRKRTKTAEDYTLKEIRKILNELGGEHVSKELDNRRYQALNIWKPLKGPVRDWPLALCDLRTVTSRDLVPMDEVYADDVLESYQVQYDTRQRWYYLKDQTVSECLIFKSADSAVQGTVPHCAFRDPDTPKGEPGRESIELRALVIY